MTLTRLAAVFILIPAAELALLIAIGTRIGALPTLGLIVVTGFIGAGFARSQGLRILTRIQEELQAGRLPALHLLDGLLVLVAGLLLITPGILTDALGFLLLLPGGRQVIRNWLSRWLTRSIQEGQTTVYWDWQDARYPRDPGEPWDPDDIYRP